jgi:hypothetical protein
MIYILSATTLLFAGLALWFWVKWGDARDDLDFIRRQDELAARTRSAQASRAAKIGAAKRRAAKG